jgi:hypothetical protein
MASHTGHNHPATPAARRACRASSGNPNFQHIDANGFTARNTVKADRGDIKMTGAVARRMARQVAAADRVRRPRPRIQPSRVTGSACVQAALHTPANGGRCACGWSA